MTPDPTSPADIRSAQATFEWPTLMVAALSYGGFFLGVIGFQSIGVLPAIVILTLAITLHSSLQHEVLHGHPFRNQHLSDLLVFPAIGLFIPYQRFRNQHLAHHYDPNLTDPYDDPESNFVDPARWVTLPVWVQAVYRFNNLLIGRMMVGPLIGLAVFYASDLAAALRGDRAVIRAYLLHFAGLAIVLVLISTNMPLVTYVLASYLAMSVLKIRTFLEHRAHEKVPGRTVIIEDRGVLAFLFLNNNFHSVHHAHPKQAWYRLPSIYANRRHEFLERNRSYHYRSYRQVFAQYFLRAKDPVPHPLMPTHDAVNTRETNFESVT